MLVTKKTFFFRYDPLIWQKLGTFYFNVICKEKKSIITVCKIFFFVFTLHEKLDALWPCLLDAVYFLEFINLMIKNVICKWLPPKKCIEFLLFVNLCWVILVKLFSAKDQFVDEKFQIIRVLGHERKMDI